MQEKTSLYLVSAAIAIISMIAYQIFTKKISADINPVVSVIGVYLVALLLTCALVPFFVPGGEFMQHAQKIGWAQIGVAVTIVGIEIGFLLMYRHGWSLSTGYIMTSVAVNIALMIIGVLFFREQLTPVNLLGLLLCIVGVAMVGFKADA
jgi:drug/metabolite transporter (DMT)-like permease